MDYWALSQVTVRNQHPLPLIPELLDYVQLAQVFTKLDLCGCGVGGGYNLVCIEGGDKWKMVIQT